MCAYAYVWALTRSDEASDVVKASVDPHSRAGKAHQDLRNLPKTSEAFPGLNSCLNHMKISMKTGPDMLIYPYRCHVPFHPCACSSAVEGFRPLVMMHAILDLIFKRDCCMHVSMRNNVTER